MLTKIELTLEQLQQGVSNDVLCVWILKYIEINTSQPPQPPIALIESPQMVSYMKNPILKKGEYIISTMKMDQYLAHTDYALWEVILNGNSVVQMTKDEAGNEIEVPLVTAQQILARTRERKEGLEKGYDRFQRLLSLLEIHRAGIDNLDIDDMYNNLKVYEADIKGYSRSSSNLQNVAFVSTESTSSTNELNAAYSVSTATCHSSQAQGPLHMLMNSCSHFLLINLVAMLFMRVKQFYKKTRRKMEFNRKEPVGFEKNKVECFNCHRRGHFARDCRSVRNSRNRSRDVGNARYIERDNGKRPAKEEDEQALVVQDGLEKEVTKTVFDNHLSDEENSVANDRFKKGKRYHAVPPPLTRNYMPPKPDMSFAGLDDSIYNFKISETVTSLTKDEKDAPKTSTACVEKPKEDRSSAPLIKDWETDSDDNKVFTPEPIPAKIDFVKPRESVKHVKPVESVKHVKPVTPVKTTEQTEKSRNFNRMAKKSVLPTNVGKGTGHRESRLVWNNVQRINHQNKFSPTTVFIRSGRIPVSAAKPKAATSTNAAKPVNIAGPKQSVNFSRTRSTFHKSHLPIRRSFYNATTHSRRNSTERVNTVGSKAVSAVLGNGVTVVKTLAVCVWRPRMNAIDQLSKDNRWICTHVQGHPQQALKNKEIVDSGCSRHMTETKAYLVDYQEIHDGGERKTRKRQNRIKTEQNQEAWRSPEKSKAITVKKERKKKKIQVKGAKCAIPTKLY
nr:hypothetical protein [Tanacetum cinerariifolium]